MLQGLSLIAGLVHLAMGAYVLIEDPRARANRLLALLCLSFFGWSACFGLYVAAPDLAVAMYWNQVSTLGWGLSPALVLHFFLVFTRRRGERLPSWALAAIYLPALVLCAAALRGPVVASGFVRTALGWAEVMDHGSPLYWLWLAYYVTFCAAALVIVWRWGHRSTIQRVRWRAWMMFLSGICSLTLATILGYAQPLVATVPMPGLSHFALLLWSGGMVVAIRKYRLLELTPQTAAQQILAGMSEAVLLLDQDHRILYANGSARRLLGARSHGLVGRDLEEAGGDALVGALDEVLEGRVSSPGFPSEHSFTFDGGRERLVSMRAFPMADSFQQRYGVALVMNDITEQRQLQRRLERADIQAQRERLASVGMLAASVAHEVNNPLGYVMANLELLLHALQDANARGHSWLGGTTVDELLSSADEALDGAERVRAIVQDLRGFAKSDRAEATERVDLTEVLESAVSLAGNELRHRAEILRELQPLPPVLANEGRLCQVFLNLLMNAAHAIPAGHASRNRIILRSWEEPESLCVEIQDTGRGIEPDELPHIFEPFHSTRARGDGAGLGLPISRRIVETMGGGIQAYSEPGVGSRFVVRLPRTIQFGNGDPVQEVSRDEPGFGQAPDPCDEPLPGEVRSSILLVDDEPVLLRAMGRIASVMFEVETADSGRDARALLEGGLQVDLVVSDLMMAEGSGMELFDWLCEHRPAQAERMLFLTGGTFTDEAAMFVDRFPDRVLRKPISRAALLAALERALS
jgi:PAS domain S-box-containing protein